MEKRKLGLVNIYLRLRHSSDPKANQAPQHQDPAVHWCKATQDPIIERPQHADLQALYGTNKHQEKSFRCNTN